MEAYDIIKNPVSTEKSMRLMESENKLIFDVAFDASKSDVKNAIQEIFNVKVDKVNILINPAGKKRAYVKFNIETPAIDIATQLGIM